MHGLRRSRALNVSRAVALTVTVALSVTVGACGGSDSSGGASSPSGASGADRSACVSKARAAMDAAKKPMQLVVPDKSVDMSKNAGKTAVFVSAHPRRPATPSGSPMPSRPRPPLPA